MNCAKKYNQKKIRRKHRERKNADVIHTISGNLRHFRSAGEDNDGGASSADPLATPEGGDSHSSCRKTNFPKNNKGNRKKLNTNECIKRKRKRVFYSLRRHGHSHLPSRPPRDGKHKNPFNCKDGEERDKIDEKRKKGESKGKDFHKGSKLADVVIMLLFFVFVCVSFSRDARVTP